jgi:hypothetical protein
MKEAHIDLQDQRVSKLQQIKVRDYGIDSSKELVI